MRRSQCPEVNVVSVCSVEACMDLVYSQEYVVFNFSGDKCQVLACTGGPLIGDATEPTEVYVV